MATTTNYGWTTPDDTSLVKDGASAIRSLGTAIDTSLNTALGTKKAGLVLLNTTSFSGVATQQINTLFSSTYRNYLLKGNFTCSTNPNTVYLRLSVSGTPTATNYGVTGQYSNVASTGTWYGSASTTSLPIGDTSTGANGQAFITLEINEPNIAGKTGMVGLYQRDDAQNARLGGVQTSSTQFDGIYLFLASGTMTGEVSVYGYNK